MFGRDKRANESLHVVDAADRFVKGFASRSIASSDATRPAQNPLEAFFEDNSEGPGIWKWRHYFKLYHSHFEKFRGKPINLLEIGIYSGGSLMMWKSYFGNSARICGVDIEPSCKVYEDNTVSVKIGDQGNRAFWKDVLRDSPSFDIVIDDGGHEYNQQQVTIEEVLPFMAPGGVYICEDIHGVDNKFSLYASRLAAHMNESANLKSDERDDERRIVNPASAFQRFVKSISFYPFSMVIEMLDAPIDELVASKHGTQWQPFLK